MIDRSFGGLLRQFRSAAGLSQGRLAELAHLSTETIGALERGVRQAPYRYTVELLAEALGLSASDRVVFESAAAQKRGHARRAREESLPQSNLPPLTTSLIGRDDDLTELAALLAQHRLVTIVGPAGIGKTRAAIETATRISEELKLARWFVDLAPIGNGEFVGTHLAAALNVPVSHAEPEEIAQELRSKTGLLIFDNCEHVIASITPIISAIVQLCPTIVVLATSRERLSIAGERTFRLPPLPAPQAIALFLERARTAEPSLAVDDNAMSIVSDICSRLDGLPLAIELAAARIRMFGLAEIRARLGDRFVLAGGGRDRPKRQQTMHTAVAWSYDLLRAEEQSVLRRLGVFTGSFRLDAAQSVCAGEDLVAEDVPFLVEALIGKSLVNVVRHPEQTRYVMLESVRTFALEQLIAKGEQNDTFGKLVLWLASYGEATYTLPLNERTILAQYELANIRTVLEWAFAATPDDLAVAAARILGYFYFAWIVSGQFTEYRYWCEKALGRLNEAEYPNVIEPLMPGMILASRGTADEDDILDTAMRYFVHRGIPNRIAWGWAAKAARLERRGQVDEAVEAIQSGLRALRDAGEEHTVYYAIPLVRYGKALAVAGRIAEARSAVKESLALAQGPGNDGYRLGLAIHMSEVEYLAGDYELAASIMEEAVAREVQPDFNTAEALASLASYRLLLGEYKAAAIIAKEAFSFLRDPSQECWFDAIQVLAAVAALHGQPISAARLIGFVDTWLQGRGYRRDRMESDSYDIVMRALRERLSSIELAKNVLAGSLLTFQAAKHEALAALADCKF